MNSPRVYATSIQVKNQQEAVQKISSAQAFADPGKRQKAERIMRSLISRRSTSMAVSSEAESRIDYLSDRLGIAKPEVIEIVTDLREAGILKDDTDMGAVVGSKGSQKHTMRLLKDFFLLEKFLADELRDRKDPRVSLKELNTKALENALASSVKNMRTIFYFWRISGLIDQLINAGSQCVDIRFEGKYEAVVKSLESRKALCSSIIEILHSLPPAENYSDGKSLVKFSLVGLSRQCKSFSLLNQDATTASVRNALLYLSKIEAFALEGGFLVIYNAMTIRRLVADNRMQYRKDDYKKLDGYYRQKIQQVHIVAKYASLLAADYGQALAFVKDYFSLDYKLFIRRYFKDESEAALSRPITQSTARRLFDGLSEIQRKIVNDKQSQFIAVAAGPGSGKTKVLVHKLASLLLLEETKSEQLLVLTFSRAAATVFKQRLIELIGSAAHYAQIKTFHSFSFDLLGKLGTLQDAQNVVADAAAMIREHKAESSRIAKSVLVVDEAQDMNETDFDLIRALIERNPEMRVIAVGDDDQNVYEFRGSDPKFFRSFAEHHATTRYEMIENYRSTAAIVDLANTFAAKISCRMKSSPGKAVNDARGQTRVILYESSAHLAKPIARIIADQHRQRPAAGTTAVLTRTNAQALEAFGALAAAGIKAKLVETEANFSLERILEVRAFLCELDKRRCDCPLVRQEDWEAALEKIARTYRESTSFEILLKLTKLYDSITPKKARYYTDFVEFVRESRIEDLYEAHQKSILVSTIHKSKGTEFDTVHLWLDNAQSRLNDEQKRCLYVAVTRTKTNLFIHESQPIFSRLRCSEFVHEVDRTFWTPPENLFVSFSLRDVRLDFFIGKKKLICSLRSGQELLARQDSPKMFQANTRFGLKNVLRMSEKGMTRLQKLQAAGWMIERVEIGFIVAWKDRKNDQEEAVVLPKFHFRRLSEQS